MAETDVRPHARLFRVFVLTRKGRPGLLLWAALLAALYAGALGVVLPYFAKPFLVKELSEELGVACSIDNLTVNPLTLKVVARDVRIPYPEAARDKPGEYLLRLERLEMVPA
ncbi:MAG: hypothetical protein LIP28_10695, partial [Deltaproteobacteria bacterium]|nr:hypothetical protein [Deltaproteobacteria bacterium]